jgi:hypothetical protein
LAASKGLPLRDFFLYILQINASAHTPFIDMQTDLVFTLIYIPTLKMGFWNIKNEGPLNQKNIQQSNPSAIFSEWYHF